MAKTQLTSLECPSCGGQLDVSSDGASAKCRFCGSNQILQQPTAKFDRLKDLPFASFTIRHCEPKISLDSIKTKMLGWFREDPQGYRAPETLDMKIEVAYLPIWFVETTVNCSWYGKYSETRTVTRYRTVTKYIDIPDGNQYESRPSRRESYEVTEPYNDTETVWHPYNGSHAFVASFKMPANTDFSLASAFLPQNINIANTQSGYPNPSPEFIVHPAVITQREAWGANGCLARITAQAYSECANMAQCLENAVPNVASADFILVFLPFAVVTYAANGREFYHLINLVNGSFNGDWVALDRNSVNPKALLPELYAVHAKQSEIDQIRANVQAEINRKIAKVSWPKLGWVFVIPVIVCFWAVHWDTVENRWSIFKLSLLWVFGIFFIVKMIEKILVAAIKKKGQTSYPKETPWCNFVVQHRQELCRLGRVTWDYCNFAANETPEKAMATFQELLKYRRLAEEDSQEAIQDADSCAHTLCDNKIYFSNLWGL